MSLVLKRIVSEIYVPPVKVLDDKSAMNQLFLAHIEQKQLFADLLSGEVDHEELLEVVEAYVGTNNMDSFIDSTEQQLNRLVGYCD